MRIIFILGKHAHERIEISIYYFILFLINLFGMLNERNLILLELIACEISFDQVRIQAKSGSFCREAQSYTGETFISTLTYLGREANSNYFKALKRTLLNSIL